MENKVKFTKSIKFKLIILFALGLIAISGVLIKLSISNSNSALKNVVHDYLMAEATYNGYIVDTVITAYGNEYLQNPEQLSVILGDVKLDGIESSYCYLVAGNGTMLYHPTAEKIGQPVENAVVTQLVQDIKAGKVPEPAVIEYEFNGVTKYAAYYVNPQSEYILVVTADESEVFEPIDKIKISLVGVSCAVLVILLAAAIIIINKFVKPLKIVSEIVNRVASLDLTKDERQDKLNKSKDEVGMISRSVGHLHDELREIITVIQEQSNTLTTSNWRFANEFNTIADTVENVNIAVEEMASGSTAQAQETAGANDNIISMGEAVEANTASVKALGSSVDKMNELARTSENMIIELEKINDKTSETIGVVTEQTNLTNVSAEKIESAVEVIQSIAAQTNLLSLNASIEAARAGESGRGFAVVAEEIRKLAEDSANSATEIESTVRELIVNSEDSVVKMKELDKDARTQAEMLGKTKDAFYGLKKEIVEVSNEAGEIHNQTNAVEELKNNVSNVIEQLAAIAQENAASTEETSASMQSLATDIDKCKEETTILRKLGENLNEQTSKFIL